MTNLSRRNFMGSALASLTLAAPFAAQAHGTLHSHPPKPAARANLSLDDRFSVLKTANGDNFNPENLRGKPTILFFGFASCSDICPTAMANIQQALEESGNPDSHNVVLITTVPAHESAETTQRFLDYFSEDFIGLAPIATDNGIFHQSASAVEEQAASVNEIYEAFGVIRDGHHSPFAYLMDEQGEFVRIFSTQDYTPTMIPDAPAP